ncbi:MAG: dihydropyrimidinase [Aquamicrobium sp.]|uniref:dihydropyrimidinase n=1 Tax=Aquamicrobium sp. TaxID=1872579 RepID=UPI00349EF584|nr:dihydropyrimidinase [Aquamicrobium sp.]MCO5155522.1 dihydropyrimidinase [Aquamicrobium sp.]
MTAADCVVRNARIATATDLFTADIAIRDGRISALGTDLPRGEEEIDATGMLVLPGGIDSHCHFDQQRESGAGFTDDFETATTAAAFGGNTCVMGFVPQFKGHGIKDLVADYHERGRKALIDYSVHMYIADPSPAVVDDELPGLMRAGHRSLKIFMAYASSMISDYQILKVLTVAKENGGLVVVHAENNDMIRWMTERLEKEGKTSTACHALAKPAIVEREAVSRMIALAELADQPIQIFHVSSAEVVEVIRDAQARGVKVYAETCPQYLAFTAADLDGADGARYLCSPALRSASDQDALWQAIRANVIGVVSSDHAPFRIDDSSGKGGGTHGLPFSKIPNGMPGIETRLPYLFSEGVGKGRISLQQFVAVTATNPAKLFGLYPRKGSIAVGMDADLTIWNPSLTRRVAYANLHDRSGYSPFEGMTLTGWPIRTIVRGRTITAGDMREGAPGWGKFLPREAFSAF